MTTTVDPVAGTDPVLIPAAAPSGPGNSFANVPNGIALQLGALGIALALLSCVFAGIIDATSLGLIVPVAFSVGALAIFAGGIINFRAGIMVAGVIGCLYGAFWLSLGLTLQFTAASLGEGFAPAFGTYLVIWGIMSLGLCLPVFFVSKVIFAQQLLLAIVFFMLAIMFHGSTGITKPAGYLGLVDAAICFYISMSIITSETTGKAILPLP